MLCSLVTADSLSPPIGDNLTYCFRRNYTFLWHNKLYLNGMPEFCQNLVLTKDLVTAFWLYGAADLHIVVEKLFKTSTFIKDRPVIAVMKSG